MTKFSQKIYFHVTVDSAEWLGYIYGINSSGKGIGNMKKRMVLLSALVLCGCMLIGAGAADAASQTQLTRQAITHFQQSPPEEDTSSPGYPTWKTW